MAPESLVDFKNASRGMREEGEDGQITTCEEVEVLVTMSALVAIFYYYFCRNLGLLKVVLNGYTL
jgi:hypothetical protein